MRGRPGSVRSLEEFGRVRLSASFFMRDFLHSEIADFHGIPNIPDNPELAIAAGRQLCKQLLEPLQATFGRLSIRSAYRAPAVNEFGNRRAEPMFSTSHTAPMWKIRGWLKAQFTTSVRTSVMRPRPHQARAKA